MKKTARTILSALLAGSMMLQTGLSSFAAPLAAADAAPAAVTATQNAVTATQDAAPELVEGSKADVPLAVSETPIYLDENGTTTIIEDEPAPLAATPEEKTRGGASTGSATASDAESAPELVEGFDDTVIPSEARNLSVTEPVEVTEAPEEAESSAAITLTSTTYNGITVEVSADAGVLPNDAYLFVAELKNRASKETAENAMDNAGMDYDDYLLLDIQIRNADGDEIEPDGNVRVNISMDAAKLPEEADASTLEVVHLEEYSNGAIKAATTVADAGLETSGSVNVIGADLEADFEVESFSFFTLLWKKRDTDATNIRLYFEAETFDGRSLENLGPNNELKLIGDLGYSESDLKDGGIDFAVRDILVRQGLDVVTVNGEQYYFHAAAIKINDQQTRFFDAICYQHGDNNDDNNDDNKLEFWADGRNKVQEIAYQTDKTVDAASNKVTLYYDTKEPGKLHPVESVKTIQDDDGNAVSVRDVIQMYMFKFNDFRYTKYRLDDDISGTYNTGVPTNYPAGNNSDGQKWSRGQLTKGLASAFIPKDQASPDLFAINSTNEWMSGDNWFDKEGKGSRQISSQQGFLNETYAAQRAEGLFVKEIYDRYEYFYYGSDEYGAHIDENGTFSLYEEVVSPAHYNENAAFFWRRGNFLPYNTINPNQVIAVTEVDMGGNQVAQGNPLYHKPVYALSEDNYTGPDGYQTRGIFNFAMSVEATFYQPVGGKVTNPRRDESGAEHPLEVPMIFRFNGDDDFWLYLDDVLVLDLGGSHDAQEGFIDFSTGKVYWTDNGSWGGNYGVQSNQSANRQEMYNYNGELTTMYWDGETTIKKMFLDAYGDAAAVDALGIWDGDTFKDGTLHTMKIYYMEQGGGASNLRMMFNIPVQPVSDLTVSKSFDENGKPKEVPDDFEATFEVYELKKENGTSGKYTEAVKVGEIELNAETVKDRTFTRNVADGKATYTYEFKNLPVSHNYVVVERIYRSDIGYLYSSANKVSGAFGYADEELSEEERALIGSLIGDGQKQKAPTHTYISNIVEMKATGAQPSVLAIANHYQTTLRVRKSVHSGNEEDLTDKEFNFRLYLKDYQRDEFGQIVRDADGNPAQMVPYTGEIGYVVYDKNAATEPEIDWTQTKTANANGYYEFTLKHDQEIKFAVPGGIFYTVAEEVDNMWRVFGNIQMAKRVATDKDGNYIKDASGNYVEDQENGAVLYDEDGNIVWEDATKILLLTDKALLSNLTGANNIWKTADENEGTKLVTDTTVTIINERQIVRTGVTLNSAPFMMMLAVVFFAAAALGAKYLVKRNREEEE